MRTVGKGYKEGGGGGGGERGRDVEVTPHHQLVPRRIMRAPCLHSLPDHNGIKNELGFSEIMNSQCTSRSGNCAVLTPLYFISGFQVD
jgi:hypothetical protein